jgi:hypothetical protein
MAGRTLRVKVPVSRLLAQAEKQREKIIREYERDVEKQGGKKSKWEVKAIGALAKTINEIEAGNFDFDNVSKPYGSKTQTSSIKVTVSAAAPFPPKEPETYRVDRDIALLKACTDTELSIGVDDDFGRYL